MRARLGELRVYGVSAHMQIVIACRESESHKRAISCIDVESGDFHTLFITIDGSLLAECVSGKIRRGYAAVVVVVILVVIAGAAVVVTKKKK